jgi:hypothetical protein
MPKRVSVQFLSFSTLASLIWVVVDYSRTAYPKFDDPLKERAYIKERLALAYRVFAHLGLCELSAGTYAIYAWS